MGFKARAASTPGKNEEKSATYRPATMDMDQFWDIIERTRAQVPNGARDEYMGALATILRQLSPEQVAQFSYRFIECLRASYHWDLWHAAYLINDGCSDDAFEDFRAWLISMGREVYENARRNPDSLAELDPQQRDNSFFEELPSVADEVYEEMTGKRIPWDRRYNRHPPPGGVQRSDEDRDLPNRFPALWAIYGDAYEAANKRARP